MAATARRDAEEIQRAFAAQARLRPSSCRCGALAAVEGWGRSACSWPATGSGRAAARTASRAAICMARRKERRMARQSGLRQLGAALARERAYDPPIRVNGASRTSNPPRGRRSASSRPSIAPQRGQRVRAPRGSFRPARSPARADAGQHRKPRAEHGAGMRGGREYGRACHPRAAMAPLRFPHHARLPDADRCRSAGRLHNAHRRPSPRRPERTTHGRARCQSWPTCESASAAPPVRDDSAGTRTPTAEAGAQPVSSPASLRFRSSQSRGGAGPAPCCVRYSAAHEARETPLQHAGKYRAERARSLGAIRAR